VISSTQNESLSQNIRNLTCPYASSWVHVQGPGGNTSAKDGNHMIIKASGFTFDDVCENAGVVILRVDEILKLLFRSINEQLQDSKHSISYLSKSDLRASMEVEFHAVLGKYVLHTHNVYVNILTCSKACELLLAQMFPNLDYIFIPFVTPGLPLAKCIYNHQLSGKKVRVFFLKNHGIIVHGETIDEVHALYSFVQTTIIQSLNLDVQHSHFSHTIKLGVYQFNQFTHGLNFENLSFLTQKILVPDQSIFFRGKMSDSDDTKDIFISFPNQTVIVQGSKKYQYAVYDMLRMIFYILAQHKKLKLETDYISNLDVNLLHGLQAEKYRQSLL